MLPPMKEGADEGRKQAARLLLALIQLKQQRIRRDGRFAEMHLIRAQVLKQQGGLAGRAPFRVLPRSAAFDCGAARGDGRSAKTAYEVIAVAEANYLLREMDAEVSQQCLVDGCDCLEVKLADGAKTELFFDVSISLAATRTMTKEGR